MNSIAVSEWNDFKSIYDHAVNRFPEVYSGYSYDSYINYLISNNLIVKNSENKISITLFGRDFLKYLADSGLSIDKLY